MQINQITNTIESFIIKLNLKFIVFLVFGISGSLSVYVSKPLLELLNYEEFISNSVIQIILRILIIFPIYQIILLAVASIFGEFNYFWKFGGRR